MKKSNKLYVIVLVFSLSILFYFVNSSAVYAVGAMFHSANIFPPSMFEGDFFFPGSVGIGTQVPSEKLVVEGTVNSSELCIGSDCIVSWPSVANDMLVASLTVATGQTIAVGDVVAIGSGGIIKSCYESGNKGIAQSAGSAGQSIKVLLRGISSIHSGLSQSKLYYANSDGALTLTPQSCRVGIAISKTQILVR